MPKYVVLLNFTEKGIKDIRENPAYRPTQRERAQAMGVTRDYYLTMGPYDAVVVVDAPYDETMARIGLSQGNVRILNMKAFPEEEADRIIGGLPPA